MAGLNHRPAFLNRVSTAYSPKSSAQHEEPRIDMVGAGRICYEHALALMMYEGGGYPNVRELSSYIFKAFLTGGARNTCII